MPKSQWIHPCNIKAGLLATLLHEVSNDSMSVRELITKLDKFDYQAKAITAIATINRE